MKIVGNSNELNPDKVNIEENPEISQKNPRQTDRQTARQTDRQHDCLYNTDESPLRGLFLLFKPLQP